MPSVTIVSSQIAFKLLFFLYHYAPAFFIDIALKLKGSKIRLVPIYSKIYNSNQLLSFFVGNQWKFSDDNMQRVCSLMSERDHQDFFCRFETSLKAYEEHVAKMIDGQRKYFFKESDEDLNEALTKLKKLKVLRYILVGILCGMVACCSLFFVLS